MKRIIEKMINDELSYDDVSEAMEEIMEGNVDDIVIGAFLLALRIKGESIEQLKAMYDSMLKHAITIKPNVNDKIIDTCGTGGDKIKTFNISTAAAFVASIETIVAKHGNRSMSGYSGSADILEALGYNLSLEPEKVEESIEELGIGFLFAPIFHPSMKYVSRARKALGIRTAFNILGPIANPCKIDAQIVGVSSPELMDKISKLLLSINREAMVFHSSDGFDELSITSSNKVIWLKDGKIDELIIDPKDLNLSSNIKDITINSKEDAIKGFLQAINGLDKPKRDIVALNASAALIIADKVDSFNEGIEVSREIIDSGKAYEKLKALIKRYGDYAKLEEMEKRWLS
ncbi:MAG: anthranilate phosphoribosyltransferase [Candidatus Nitrosocaldaceae archaeon]|nr:MAG: anthranilate phosphoribosyltransferase [Candidatus Nitrosocaldaceae archaeon]